MSQAPQGIPQWPVVAPDGSGAGFVRMPPYGDAPNGDEGLYWGRIGEAPVRLSELVPSAPPALDREGRRLAVAFVEEEMTTVEIFSVLGDGAPSVRLARFAGSAQQVAWRADGEVVLAIVAEPGSDTASLTSGARPGSSKADPIVATCERGQRVWQLDIEGQRAQPVTSPELSVWEIAPFDLEFTICVCSSAPGEAAWYSAWIGRLDHASGNITVLYRPTWQVMGLTADPSSGRVAFVEAWASDRISCASTHGRCVVEIVGSSACTTSPNPAPCTVIGRGWEHLSKLFIMVPAPATTNAPPPTHPPPSPSVDGSSSRSSSTTKAPSLPQDGCAFAAPFQARRQTHGPKSRVESGMQMESLSQLRSAVSFSVMQCHCLLIELVAQAHLQLPPPPTCRLAGPWRARSLHHHVPASRAEYVCVRLGGSFIVLGDEECCCVWGL